MPPRHSFCNQGFASDIAQQPLKHLFDGCNPRTWQGQSGRTRNARQPFLGETVLSELLAWKCESIRSEFDLLIEDKSQGDKDHVGPRLASCAPGAGHRHEGTHADSRLLSGVAIRHADRKPCLRLPSVAPHLSTEETERGLREEG